MASSPTFVIVWVTIFFVTTRTPVVTIWEDVAVLPNCLFIISVVFFAWSEELSPVLHHIAKFSQLLIKGLYFFSPSLLVALSTTVARSKQCSCNIKYTTSLWKLYLPLTTFANSISLSFLGGEQLTFKNSLAVLEYSMTSSSSVSTWIPSTMAWCQ